MPTHTVTSDGAYVINEAVRQQAYAGHVADRTNPDISPLYGDLHGFPPVLLVVGALDIVLEDSLAMAARLSAAGNEVDLRVYPESRMLSPPSRLRWLRRPSTGSSHGWPAGSTSGDRLDHVSDSLTSVLTCRRLVRPSASGSGSGSYAVDGGTANPDLSPYARNSREAQLALTP